MGAVRIKAFADLRSRRLQGAALAAVMFLACGAATLALSILDGSTAPFDRAFARANGAHLVIDYAAAVSDERLLATAHAEGVEASAGPWASTTAAFGDSLGGLLRGQVVSGRPEGGTSIDEVTVRAGRWWQAPGEIVLDQDTAMILDRNVGDSVAVYAQPQDGGTGGKSRVPVSEGPAIAPPGKGQEVTLGPPTVTQTVVGIAASVSTPDVAGWMSPADLAALTGGERPVRQMLYRVDAAGTAAELATATRRIVGDLAGAPIVNVLTYLETRAGVTETADLYVPVLLAFSIFALLAAAFTIANVVSGVVLTGYREIGVMKAVGFTPSQVTSVLLMVILVPVTIGALAGVIAGSIGSRPAVERTTQSFGVPGASVLSLPVVLGVLAVSLTVAGLAAIGPAVHAGRSTSIDAMTRGTAPSPAHHGGRLRRLGLRLPASTPFRLGVASGAAHPIRAAMTLGALVVGVAAVTFAAGLNLSLVRVVAQLDRTVASPVRVQLLDTSMTPEAVSAQVAAEAAGGRSVAIGESSVSAAGSGPGAIRRLRRGRELDRL